MAFLNMENSDPEFLNMWFLNMENYKSGIAESGHFENDNFDPELLKMKFWKLIFIIPELMNMEFLKMDNSECGIDEYGFFYMEILKQ